MCQRAHVGSPSPSAIVLRTDRNCGICQNCTATHSAGGMMRREMLPVEVAALSQLLSLP